MAILNADDIPHADYMSIGVCAEPECSKLHIIMFDANNKPMVVGSIDNPVGHIECVRRWAYIAATRRTG